jgi:hypothetical protein
MDKIIITYRRTVMDKIIITYRKTVMDKIIITYRRTATRRTKIKSRVKFHPIAKVTSEFGCVPRDPTGADGVADVYSLLTLSRSVLLASFRPSIASKKEARKRNNS